MTAPIALRDILEKDWQRTVRQLADTLGYRRAYHTYDSRRSDSGFPDLVLVHPERKRIIYLELKREQGQLSNTQRDWLQALADAGAEVYVARPRHLQALTDVLGHHRGHRWWDAHRELLAELNTELRHAA